MRDLTINELEFVCGGTDAPLGSETAGEYFNQCMEYTNPNATWGAALTGASALPYVGTYISAAAFSWTAGTVFVCGIGTLQYFQ